MNLSETILGLARRFVKGTDAFYWHALECLANGCLPTRPAR